MATTERFLREMVGLRHQLGCEISNYRITRRRRVPFMDFFMDVVTTNVDTTDDEAESVSGEESDEESDSNDIPVLGRSGEGDVVSTDDETESESDGESVTRDVLVLWVSRRGEPLGCCLRLSRYELPPNSRVLESDILRVCISVYRPGGRWELNYVYPWPLVHVRNPSWLYVVAGFRPGLPRFLNLTPLIIAFNGDYRPER